MIRLYSINQLNNSLADRENALGRFIGDTGSPGVLIQTCNRIELYYGEGIVPDDIAKHLFRVVSGLESSLTGEIAIQGQIKNSYRQASEKFSLTAGLHLLFQTALFVGKRVRTESDISRGAVSHSQAAVEIILRSNLTLDNTLISLIGVHKLNEDIIRFLQRKGAETIFLANKSFEKAETIARIYNCKIMQLDQLPEMLKFSDILISATSAPHLIVKYENFPAGRKMLILDLAFPRDVDERIGHLPGITLYNLENIENAINQNIEKRKSEIQKAEQIIEEEVILFREKQIRKMNYII